MNWYYKLRMIYKILLPVTITLVLVLALLAWQIQSKSSEIVQSVAERELAALGGKYGGETQRFIDLALTNAIKIADTIAELETDGTPLHRQQIINILRNVCDETISSAGAAFLPATEDINFINTLGSDENGQFYPFIASDGVRLMDKKYFDTDYITIPQKTKKPYITAPYVYTADNGKDILMVTISAPVLVDGVFKGIIAVDLSLEVLSDAVNKIQLYTTGGASVTTQDGSIMMHQNPNLVLKNILEFDEWRNNKEIKIAFEAGESYLALAPNGDSESFFYFEPFTFPQTGQTMYFILIVPRKEVLAEVAQLTTLTLIASVIALIILLLVITIGVRTSIKPLALLAKLADDVAQGDFNAKVDTRTFGGEILALNNSLKTMLSSLVENISNAESLSKDAQEQTLKAQEAMREAELAQKAEAVKQEKILAAAAQLEKVVNVISTASQELFNQIKQSEQGSTEQAEHVTETATAMEEMNCTVIEMSRSANSASETSAEARMRADAGAKVVQQAVAGIEAVQAVSLALKEDMSTLATKAKAISEIMHVISDIADQTNLLALNAAIEAARAGDAGRGFAVVADEVRKLAEKTMTSTTDVGNAIQSIQSSVDASIAQVEKAAELIVTATEQSNQSGEALNEIMDLVDTTADQVRSIAIASGEQSSASDEINRAIMEINDISNQSAQTMRDAALAVDDLAQQAHTLSTLIDEMKQV